MKRHSRILLTRKEGAELDRTIPGDMWERWPVVNEPFDAMAYDDATYAGITLVDRADVQSRQRQGTGPGHSGPALLPPSAGHLSEMILQIDDQAERLAGVRTYSPCCCRAPLAGVRALSASAEAMSARCEKP